MSVTTVIGSPVDHEKQILEYQVNVAYTPGDLLEISTGKTQRHSVASGQTAPMFGVENPSNGGTIDTDTFADEIAPVLVSRSNDRIYAWLADTVAVVAGVTKLVSNGDGSLKAAVGTEDDAEIVGTADETKTATGKTRCWIRAA